MQKHFYFPILVIGASLFFSSCKKDTVKPVEETPVVPVTPTYTIPTSYNFTNVNFKTSTQRLSMLGEILTYIRTAHTTTANPVLDGQKLKDMYANLNNRFNDATLNTSGIQLKDKTLNTFNLQTDLDATLLDVGTITQTTATGSNGVAGKVVSGTKAYLMDANGFEHKEVVEKGIMAGLLYYQATTLLKNIATFDNTTIVAEQGTAQEHAWDEAFGYFGVPLSFPTTTTGLVYWGSYCNAVNSAIGSNAIIMNAWLKGRAAITNKDDGARDAARDIVVATWEKVVAARFITYAKGAKTSFADDAVRNHSLSEAIGFIRAFKYNPSKTISDADITLLSTYIGNNLYTISSSNIQLAIDKMAVVFGLDASKL